LEAIGYVERGALLHVRDAPLHPLLHLPGHHDEDAEDLPVHHVLEDEEAGARLADDIGSPGRGSR